MYRCLHKKKSKRNDISQNQNMSQSTPYVGCIQIVRFLQRCLSICHLVPARLVVSEHVACMEHVGDDNKRVRLEGEQEVIVGAGESVFTFEMATRWGLKRV
jgi:hypothetical protein